MARPKKYDVRYVYLRAKHYLWCVARVAATPSEHYIRSIDAPHIGSLTARDICRLSTQQQVCEAESLFSKVLVAAGFLACVALVVFMG